MNDKVSQERKLFTFKLLFSISIVSIWWLIHGLNSLFSLHLQQYGLKPRVIEQWYGIFTYPFLHGSWEHLVSNSLPGVILLTGLFIFHSKNSFKFLTILYLVSGVILWFIGRENTTHIGASGVVYALAFFLLTAGFIARERSSIALSFFIILWYGGMLWGIFPFSVEQGTSWEGHLAGAITGFLLAFFTTKRPIKTENKELAEVYEHFYEKHKIE